MSANLANIVEMQDILWILISTGSVFLMQAGFCFLEAGSVRSKNSINVAVKNFSDFLLASILFWCVGFSIMYAVQPLNIAGGYLFFSQVDSPHLVAFFLFQLVFCGTASTIMSGAVAERTTFIGYLLMAFFVSVVIYPVFGRWAWNGAFEGQALGWLNQQGFVDFAGSSVVHSVGGWASLAAVIIIGPRIGRFGKNATPIQGHNIPMATVGTIMLWFGWFGFNGGSALQFDGSIPRIILNTNLSACAGALTALGISWWLLKKPDVPHILNGALSGLVGITASCNAVMPHEAIIIGSCAGFIYFSAVRLLEKLEIDDVIGVTPVHAFCGVWGTLCVALFGDPEILGTSLGFSEQLWIQVKGIIVCFIWSFIPTYIFLSAVNRKWTLRVKEEDEIKGLNVVEHNATTEILDVLLAMQAYESSVDFGKRVNEEPHTEAGQIAREYNRIIDKVSYEMKVSEQKNIDLAESYLSLRSAQSQLVESEKMASLGGLVAGVAHEINTPVGVGVTAASFLEEKVKAFEAQYQAGKLTRKDIEAYIATTTESSNIISKNMHRAADLILSFKQVAVDQSNDERRELKVRLYIEEILASLKPNLKGGKYEVQVNCADHIVAYSYPGAISQILTNLIMNSLKHGFEYRDEGCMTIDVTEIGDRLKLIYRDNGLGMRQADVDKIFEPFFTTKRGKGGSGLGMHITFNLATQTLNGAISCTSQLGDGVKFELEFPRQIGN